MNERHIQKSAGELKIQPRQIAATTRLFAEGATVPFIARYRKEVTHSGIRSPAFWRRSEPSASPAQTAAGRLVYRRAQQKSKTIEFSHG
jgi:hypothetical protein